MTEKIRFVTVTCFVILLTGCTTIGDSFLVQNLEDTDKARALTEKGIELYKRDILANENYASIRAVGRYFETALGFDPANRTAREYIARLSGLKDEFVKEKVAIAAKYLKSAKRSETDNYNLCYAVQKAYEADPANADVINLRKTIEPIVSALVKKYNATAAALAKQVTDKDGTAKRERLFLDIHDNYRSALRIKPDDAESMQGMKNAEAEIAGLFTLHMNEARKSIAARSYAKAETEVKALSAINRRLGGQYEDPVNGVTYDLYIAWAKQTVDSKNYESAAVFIDKALVARKTAEAAGLRDAIDKERNKALLATMFGRWIADIDNALANKDYVTAYWKIKDLKGKVTTPAHADAVRYRETRVSAAIPELFKSAVSFYNEEKFVQAIGIFTMLADTDRNNAEVREYLDRAQAKQKVLEAY